MSCSWRLWLVLVLFGLPNNPTMGQGDKSHVLISFDEKGTLEQPGAWAKVKKDIIDRNHRDIFIIVHGWRVSKNDADVTVATLAKRLHEQAGKNDSIQVIGVRWPSLLGDNATVGGLALKKVAGAIAGSIGKSETVKERKDKLKTTLKTRNVQLVVSLFLHFQFPDAKQLDQMIDNLEDVENIESALTILSYYEMKRRANLIGSKGVQEWLTELQKSLPSARYHLVGHSFGCKVCLACLACEGRADKQVDSVTLLQGAVSALCFAGKIEALKDMSKGAYADVPKRVKGCICATFTKADTVLGVAYVAASQAAGQVAELPGMTHQRKLDLYAALGAKGITGMASVPMRKKGDAYKIQPGLNSVNADDLIKGHDDILHEHVAWLIWSTARLSHSSPN